MRVHIHGSDRALARAMRSHIERRLRWTLSRYVGLLADITVRVADPEGSNGGAGGGCRISAEVLPSGRRIEHEVGDPCLFSAIDAAVERMGRSVRREVEGHADRPVRR